MADIIRLNSQVTTTSSMEEVEDPKVIKVAKLALILADKNTDALDKLACIKVAIRFGYITEEEGTQLLAYRPELEEFMSDSTENEQV